MKIKLFLFVIILLILLYFFGIPFTGNVVSETCCTGESCDNDSRCVFEYDKTPENNLNIILETVLVISLLGYIIFHYLEKKH